MSKYVALRIFLEAQKAERVPMTFAEIERIVGFQLPKSQMYPAWWSNNPTNNVMTNEWLAAGYKTEQVDIEGRKLVFSRVNPRRPPPADVAASDAQPRRHPGFGLMKGLTTIAPGTDLTAPTGDAWGGSE